MAINIDRGRIVSIGSGLKDADAWALTSGVGWLGILGGKPSNTIGSGGNRRLVDAVVASLASGISLKVDEQTGQR